MPLAAHRREPPLTHPPSRRVVFIERYRIAIADHDRARTA